VKHCRHKEKNISNDVKILVDLMHREEVHVKNCGREDRFIWTSAAKSKRKEGNAELIPAVVDLIAKGMGLWNNAVAESYIGSSVYDVNAGHPVFDEMDDSYFDSLGSTQDVQMSMSVH
jgi:hypothetical protein